MHESYEPSVPLGEAFGGYFVIRYRRAMVYATGMCHLCACFSTMGR